VKARLAALGLCAVLVVASLAFAQQGKSVAGSRSAERTPRNDASVYSELAKAPEKARLRPNPLSQDLTAIAAGRLLFERHCAECHGDSAEGKKGPSLRAEEVQNATPGALFWILTNGVVRRGMPVWSRLPEPQRWQLVAYIQSLAVKNISRTFESRVKCISVTQKEKAARFRALHDGPGVFVIPNPWDVASTRILAGLGFEALATSSAASACVLGLRDGGLTRGSGACARAHDCERDGLASIS